MADAGPLIDLPALLAALKDEYLAKWTKKAQRQSLVEWRDNTQPPGVRARFLESGADYYDQSDRSFKYRKRKGFLPNYVYTGRLREQLMKRRPVSPKTGNTDVVSRFSLMGGALNLLNGSTMKGFRGTYTVVVKELVRVRAHHRVSRLGKGYDVRAYTQTQTHKRTNGTVSNKTYAEEFQIATGDKLWINRRTEQLREQIIRKAVLTKGGGLRRGARARFNDIDAFRNQQGIDG